MGAVARWAKAGDGDDLKKSAALLGISGVEEEPEVYEIWPENLLPWQIFIAAAREWEWLSGMTAVRTNLKGGLIWELIDRHPDAPADKEAAWALFETICAMEQYALQIFSEKSSETQP